MNLTKLFFWMSPEDRDRRMMRAAEVQQEFLTGKKWKAQRILPDGRVELVEEKT